MARQVSLSLAFDISIYRKLEQSVDAMKFKVSPTQNSTQEAHQSPQMFILQISIDKNWYGLEKQMSDCTFEKGKTGISVTAWEMQQYS